MSMRYRALAGNCEKGRHSVAPLRTDAYRDQLKWNCRECQCICHELTDQIVIDLLQVLVDVTRKEHIKKGGEGYDHT